MRKNSVFRALSFLLTLTLALNITWLQAYAENEASIEVSITNSETINAETVNGDPINSDGGGEAALAETYTETEDEQNADHPSPTEPNPFFRTEAAGGEDSFLNTAIGFSGLLPALAAEQVAVQPGDVFEEHGIYYRVIEPGSEDSPGTVEVIANPMGLRYTDSIIIPESAKNESILFQVVGIGASAFRGATLLTSVSLPNTITFIGANAFESTSRLFSITLPDSVETIGHSAFDYSGIFSIVIPPKVTELPQYSLFANNITEITLPAGLISVHHDAFGQKVLQFNVEKGNPVFAASDGVLFSANMKTLFKYPAGRTEKAYVVPDGIETIASYSFTNLWDLADISFPASLLEIKSDAFRNIRSYDVSLRFQTDEPPLIEDFYAFQRGFVSIYILHIYPPTGSLKTYQKAWGSYDVVFPEDTGGEDGEVTFSDGLLTYKVISGENYTVCVIGLDNEESLITVPKTVLFSGIEYTVTEIADYCFVGSGIEEIALPDTVNFIGEYAFYLCIALERVVIPDNVAALPDGAFGECLSLREVVLPASLSSYHANSFTGCGSLEAISISQANKVFYTADGVLYGRIQHNDRWGNPLFETEKLTLLKYPAAKPGLSFTVPDGVEVISAGAFSDEGELVDIIMPATVIYVFAAFNPDVESITFLSETPPEFAFNAFAVMKFVLYVPTEESVAAYQQALDDFKPGGMVTLELMPVQNPDDNNEGTGTGTDPGKGTGSTGGGKTGGVRTGGGSVGIDNSPVPLAPTYSSTATTSDFRSLQGPLAQAIKTANADKSDTAALRIINYKTLDLDTMKQLAAEATANKKSLLLHADTVKNGIVQVRLQFYPGNATKTLRLSGSVDSDHGRDVKTLFEHHFQNKIVVVELTQNVDFGMYVNIAAKVNLGGLNTRTLYFYSYDTATNIYSRINNTWSYVDANGYLWFRTRLAGDIIITDKELQQKPRYSNI